MRPTAPSDRLPPRWHHIRLLNGPTLNRGDQRMAHRSFRDSRGRSWQAYDVTPKLPERRSIERRRARRSVIFSDRRAGVDRRLAHSRRAVLPTGFATGWLCFQADEEKRRLTPIPGDWLECEERELERYCEAARAVSEPRPSMG